eukprot:6059278-Lingulodinium_polyedra.AAC.1
MAPPPPGCSSGGSEHRGTENRSAQLLACSAPPAAAVGLRCACRCSKHPRSFRQARWALSQLGPASRPNASSWFRTVFWPVKLSCGVGWHVRSQPT